MTDITPNHPAANNALYVHMCHFFPSEKGKSGRQKVAEIITAALPHLTADDLRNTPAGRALMAEGWTVGAEYAGWGTVDDYDNPYRGGDA